jgi:protein-S-isoprenylcysteine O-methyltransferase Ste14
MSFNLAICGVCLQTRDLVRSHRVEHTECVCHSSRALLLLALVCAFQLQRMKYEERVLFQVFPKYGDYMARTARLMPGVY